MPTRIEKLGHSLRTEGLRRTSLRVADHLIYLRNRWIDRGFDRRFGTDTSGVIPKADLGLGGEHADAANHYEPVQLPVFRRIMRDLPIDHANYAFLDLGSGKGRALLMASQYPFRRIIGVELSPVLHGAAARNVALYAQRRPMRARIELVCGDALTYPIPEGDVVCFLYNSFGRPLIEELISSLELAHRAPSRNIFVVYRNPVCAELFESAGFLSVVARDPAYRIYRSR
jgi:SAM-dependent methyltransferase